MGASSWHVHGGVTRTSLGMQTSLWTAGLWPVSELAALAIIRSGGPECVVAVAAGKANVRRAVAA
jgi:hypothetical protein